MGHNIRYTVLNKTKKLIKSIVYIYQYISIYKLLFFCVITVSLIAFVAMALLAFLEFFVYRDTWMKYEYEVDKDFSRSACRFLKRTTPVLNVLRCVRL